MIALHLRCPKHPRYMAVLAPRVKNCTGCTCAGIWTIAQWARGAECQDSARETVVRVHRELLHSLKCFTNDAATDHG